MDKSRRLNLSLDEVSFGRLEKINKRRGDPTYTHTIKRAILLLEFIDNKIEEGARLYFADKDSSKLKEIILGP